MRLFDYSDYKLFITDRIHAMPNRGRGELGRLARHMRVHSSLISQVVRGHRELSVEQACDVADYFRLDAVERDFFVTLVQRARAGTKRLEALFNSRLETLTKTVNQGALSTTASERELTESERAYYYSYWYVSAIRLLSSISSYQSIQAIALRLELPVATVEKIAENLMGLGLVQRDEHNAALIRATNHNLGEAAESIWKLRDQENWRLRAMERLSRLQGDELAFTVPLKISRSDFDKLRGRAREFIQEAQGLADDSSAQDLVCLNVDLFRA